MFIMLMLPINLNQIYNLMEVFTFNKLDNMIIILMLMLRNLGPNIKFNGSIYI